MLHKIDLSRVDLNLLVLFEAVLEERHVGRAAARMNLSSSAVSHGLSRLRRLLNDPLFLRNPKGVVPTERAFALADPVADALHSLRAVLANAEPFDPAIASRRFVIGAPDSVAVELLLPLFARIRKSAPNIDLGIRALLPDRLSWENAFTELDARKFDIAVLLFNEAFPSAGTIPARFALRMLHDDVFVIAMRRGHPFGENPSLESYCRAQHVLSSSGDNYGYLDEVLAERALSRRVALTVPNFMTALAAVAETDLLSALPLRFAVRYGRRFDVVTVAAPVQLQPTQFCAVYPKAASVDPGLQWLIESLEGAAGSSL